MLKRGFIAVACAALILTGCETTGPKQQSGAVIGAVAGGLIGSQFGGSGRARLAGGLIGAVAGGVIGGSIGAQLDAQDRARLRAITTASVRTGKRQSFRSKSGVRASTQVIHTSSTSGQQCRTVQQNVTFADGRVSRDTVTGCKGPNGWSV